MTTYSTEVRAWPVVGPAEAHFTKDRLLRINEVRARVGLSRSAIDRLEKAGLFPSRRKIGKSRVVWLEREIDAWIAALPKGGARG